MHLCFIICKTGPEELLWFKKNQEILFPCEVLVFLPWRIYATADEEESGTERPVVGFSAVAPPVIAPNWQIWLTRLLTSSSAGCPFLVVGVCLQVSDCSHIKTCSWDGVFKIGWGSTLGRLVIHDGEWVRSCGEGQEPHKLALLSEKL